MKPAIYQRKYILRVSRFFHERISRFRSSVFTLPWIREDKKLLREKKTARQKDHEAELHPLMGVAEDVEEKIETREVDAIAGGIGQHKAEERPGVAARVPAGESFMPRQESNTPMG